MGDGFYRLQDPTNNIKVLKEHRDYTINRKIQQWHNKHKTICRWCMDSCNGIRRYDINV